MRRLFAAPRWRYRANRRSRASTRRRWPKSSPCSAGSAVLLDRDEQAEDARGRFEATAGEIARRQAAHGNSRPTTELPRVLLLEWLDPPFCSGHWNPEIFDLAGGIDPIGRSGEKSRRITWDEVAASRPDVIIVAPCGFALDRGASELDELGDRPEWYELDGRSRRSRRGRRRLGLFFAARPPARDQPADRRGGHRPRVLRRPGSAGRPGLAILAA